MIRIRRIRRIGVGVVGVRLVAPVPVPIAIAGGGTSHLGSTGSRTLETNEGGLKSTTKLGGFSGKRYLRIFKAVGGLRSRKRELGIPSCPNIEEFLGKISYSSHFIWAE